MVRIFISYRDGMRLAACMASWLLPLSSFPVETWLHDRRLGYGKRIKKKECLFEPFSVGDKYLALD
jgi:hypothetical protein